MESTFGIGHAARLLGTKVKTLQRWERKGLFVQATRTAHNCRVFSKSKLWAVLE